MKSFPIGRSLQGLFLLLLLVLLSLYSRGYENSIGWEVTTSAEVIEYPGITVKGQLQHYVVTGEKYLLNESYTGGRINRNLTVETLFSSLMWIGLCLVLVGASFFKRILFFITLALFTLLLNRLNLPQFGLFGQDGIAALIIPFIAFIGPLFYFHEYRPQTPFLLRFLTLLILSIVILIFGVENRVLFVDHFQTHSLFSFAIAGILFLFIVAEENMFFLLRAVTNTKGGKSNHIHFIVLSLVYLTNLILYYLNKSGLVPNSFSFFDPFILLAITSVVTLWTIKYKVGYLAKYIDEVPFFTLVFGLGTILLSLLSMHFFKGTDAVYESFHYFILYFHLGFGFFFFLYIIINFIDPLVQGLEVFKIAYKEQHFPYISARLGGLAAILGFYFLATQEPYSLLKSGYYAGLGDQEQTLGNADLAIQYYQQAAFLGYNTHYANYQLAWSYSDKGNKYLTQTHFEKAAQRFPSPFAAINYANLDKELNLPKVQATLDQAAAIFPHGEISNNQGVLRMQSEEWERALLHFEKAESSDTWNQAPLLNKWSALYRLHLIDSANRVADYEKGNAGVRSNMLVSLTDDTDLDFEIEGLMEAPVLHQHAYLLNAASLFAHDSLAPVARRVLDQSSNGNFNDRLRKGLVVHYYNRGDVNHAFRMLDFLQANSYERNRGMFLNDLGVLSLDQGATRLALEFFEKAKDQNYLPAEFNRLEALAWLDRSEEIPGELLQILEKDPGLTTAANDLLDKLKTATFEISPEVTPTIDESVPDSILVAMASKNAFQEKKVIAAVLELNRRQNAMAYNIILEASEINPYSPEILKQFVMTALEQNLADYAEEVLPRIQELVPSEEYIAFERSFWERKEELDSQAW